MSEFAEAVERLNASLQVWCAGLAMERNVWVVEIDDNGRSRGLYGPFDNATGAVRFSVVYPEWFNYYSPPLPDEDGVTARVIPLSRPLTEDGMAKRSARIAQIRAAHGDPA